MREQNFSGSQNDYQVRLGDCIQSLLEMPAQSVHCCVTSPPYYGLRDYGAKGQIGLENTPEQFLNTLVKVFREVRRVLRDDGTIWINMGDSWDKSKQMMGMPWRLALALQADGWFLRQDIIWNKPNAMPESVRDRCTKAHEYVFLLSKSSRYYFDYKSIKEPANLTGKGNANSFRGGAYVHDSTFNNSDGGKRTVTGNSRSRRNSFKRVGSKREQTIPGQSYGTHRPGREESGWDVSLRNKRSVWSVATRGYKEAHFATFPPALIEPCILAGCPAGGTTLDIFGGSGTVAGVAIAHGRNAIICELNPEYAKLIPDRVDSIVRSIVCTDAQEVAA